MMFTTESPKAGLDDAIGDEPTDQRDEDRRSGLEIEVVENADAVVRVDHVRGATGSPVATSSISGWPSARSLARGPEVPPTPVSVIITTRGCTG
jgi:hypothetical protein